MPLHPLYTPAPFALIATACLAAQPPAPPTPAAPTAAATPTYADPAAWAAATDITQLRALRDQLLADPDAAKIAIKLLDSDPIGYHSDQQALIADAFLRLGPKGISAVNDLPFRAHLRLDMSAWFDTLTNEQVKEVIDTWGASTNLSLAAAPLNYIARLYTRGVDVTPWVISYMQKAQGDKLFKTWRALRGDRRLFDAGKALMASDFNKASYMMKVAGDFKDDEVAAHALRIADKNPREDWVTHEALVVAARHATDTRPTQQRILSEGHKASWRAPHLLEAFPFLDTADPEVAAAFIRINAATATSYGQPIDDAQEIWAKFSPAQVQHIADRFRAMTNSDRLQVGGALAAYDTITGASDKQYADALDAIDVKTLSPDSAEISMLVGTSPEHPLFYAATLRLYKRVAVEAPTSLHLLDFTMSESLRRRAYGPAGDGLLELPTELLDTIPRTAQGLAGPRETSLLRMFAYAQSLPSDLATPILGSLNVNPPPSAGRVSEPQKGAVGALAKLAKPPESAIDWLIDHAFSPRPPRPRHPTAEPELPEIAADAFLDLASRHPEAWDRLELRRQRFAEDAVTLIAATNPIVRWPGQSPLGDENWTFPLARIPAMLDTPTLQQPTSAQLKTRILRNAVLLGHRDDAALALAKRTLTTAILDRTSDPAWCAVALVRMKEPGSIELAANLLDDERPRMRDAGYQGLLAAPSIADLAPARPKLLAITSGPLTHQSFLQAAVILAALDRESPEALALLTRMEASKDPQLAATADRLRTNLQKQPKPLEPKP